jgi:hypothetical protein
MDPVAISLTSNPTLTNVTFISNLSQAIKIIDGTLSSDAILYPRSIAGINNIAYIIDNNLAGGLTISSNATLTIKPGVVVKFRDWGIPHYNNINCLSTTSKLNFINFVGWG